MKKKRIYQVLLLAVFFSFLFLEIAEWKQGEPLDLNIEDLKVDYVKDPVGIDHKHPLFSWKITSHDYNIYQKSYQIKVYQTDPVTSKRKLVWNSGKVKSSQNINISYQGKELQNASVYEWQLAVWDENNQKHEAVQNGVFETAFVNGNPFENCDFIAVDDKDLSVQGLPVFVKTFHLEEKEVKKAYYYGTALGLYDVYLNGKRMGRGDEPCEELKPGWTNYDKSLLYNTYDLTELLNGQTNHAIAIMLAKGWCLGEIAHETYQYDRPWYMGKILVLYEDGTREEIVTDSTWSYSTDTVVRDADIYSGEIYDANRYHTRELSDYLTLQNRNLELKKVVSKKIGSLNYFSWYGKKVTTQKAYSIREKISLPMRIKKNETVILDMGQNLTALPYMKLTASKGSEVVLKFAEMLNDTGEEERGNDGPAGTLYRANLRSAKAQVRYIADGKTREYQSVFSYFGYRYVSITPDADIILEDFESKFVGITGECVGTINTDHKKVNQLFQNIQWSQRDNWLLVATDCPQRDERLPWTGDIQVFCKTSLYNDELHSFYLKWCRDAIDSQINGTYPNIIPYNKVTGTGNAGWGDAGIILPYRLYHHYDDKQFIKMMYPSMQKYMQWLESSDLNGANPVYGDWLAYEPTDEVYVAIAYYAQNAMYMNEMANAIGEYDDAADYRELFDKIKEHFHKLYVREEHLTEKSQTACVLALNMQLVEGDLKENIKKDLKNYIVENGYRLSTGFIGTSLLLPVLSENGMEDLAYRLLLQEQNPSWLYSVNQGATTIWERWDSYTEEAGFYDNGMNSFNHFSYGSVGQWMYENMLGLQYDPAGSKEYQFTIEPHICLEQWSEISECQGSYCSPLGIIGLYWKETDNGVVYQIDIPANTKGKIILRKETLGEEGVIYMKNRKASLEDLEKEGYVQDLEIGEEEISFLLTSGSYKIR